MLRTRHQPIGPGTVYNRSAIHHIHRVYHHYYYIYTV